MLPFWQFITLVLAALGLTMTSAHVLEMPQKMAYSPELYAAVNTTLYRYFAIVGGTYQLGGIVSAWVLTAVLRNRRRRYTWSLAGATLLLLSFVSWLVLVEPVNLRIGSALAAAPDMIPALWQELQNRWEYGHATGFVLHLLGFCALVISVIREGDGPGFARRSPLPVALSERVHLRRHTDSRLSAEVVAARSEHDRKLHARRDAVASGLVAVSPKVPLRERTTGAGFQIPFERQGARLVAKCDHDVEFPGTIPHGVNAFTRVVFKQSCLHVGRYANVVAISIADTAKHVDQSFGWDHDRRSGNGRAGANF